MPTNASVDASVRDVSPSREVVSSVNNTSANDIRGGFLDFFAERDHQVVPSAPLVPRNDPTLMFVNAGMVPFKNVFTGLETRPFSRATSAQKCVRAGGKHNDLDNVGYTARHHTFFEMLGNFSFGDYFKEQAILLAWELLTKDWELDKKPLESPSMQTTTRRSTCGARSRASRRADHPHRRLGQFLVDGRTGPCGPCSEIFYDHGRA